jgi:hypothetical protein
MFYFYDRVSQGMHIILSPQDNLTDKINVWLPYKIRECTNETSIDLSTAAGKAACVAICRIRLSTLVTAYKWNQYVLSILELQKRISIAPLTPRVTRLVRYHALHQVFTSCVSISSMTILDLF